jgi:hypothetical protein
MAYKARRASAMGSARGRADLSRVVGQLESAAIMGSGRHARASAAM